MRLELAPARCIAVGAAGGAANRREDRREQLLFRREAGDPVDELFLERLRARDRLVAVVPVSARRAEVAPHGRPRAAGPVHACAATLAVQELAQQVVLRWRTGLDDTRPPRAHLLHAIEQLLGDDR